MKRTLVVAQAAAAEKSGVVEGGKSKSGRSLVSKHSQSDGTGGESKSEAFRNWVIDAWKDKRLTDKDICELAWHATEAGQMKHKVGLLVAPLSAPSLNVNLIVLLVSCMHTQDYMCMPTAACKLHVRVGVVFCLTLKQTRDWV